VELVSLLVGYQPTGAVGYISYNMGTSDLPEIYTLALGPAYNYYIIPWNVQAFIKTNITAADPQSKLSGKHI